MKQYSSWGRYPEHRPTEVHPVRWRQDVLPPTSNGTSILPYGIGRSYGDSCLNSDGLLLDMAGLDRFISFDSAKGLLRCEAGVTLEQVLELTVPCGWFPPVTPGTKYVTIGGAIANDVHGKNHHVSGTFGKHVTRFELLRSDGSRLECTPRKNADLYKATIGGLGLTGLITWVEFRLRSIANPFISMETIKFKGLDEFIQISRESDRDYEYTVAWIDCAAASNAIGRGLFMRGNHAGARFGSIKWKRKRPWLSVPFSMPSFTINRWSIKAFNTLYYQKQLGRLKRSTVPYEPFFYPLDMVRDWNRIYGKQGFFQYQSVVPADDVAPIREMLLRVSKAGQGSFLSVLKLFGKVPSPGILSFPRPGLTLTIDIPNKGDGTLKLLDELDEITFAAGGALYPAKDARMTPEHFRASYPALEKFIPHIDPRFSSSFWRRVMETT